MLKRIILLILAFAVMLSSSAFAYDDYGMPYYIEVDITNQIVTIYNTSDNSIARQMLTSSGMNGCTPLGTFHLTEKGRASERSEWTYFQQYQCWVKYATRIYLGYMFHSLPFEEKDMSTMITQHVQEFGMPTSHGCMRLRVEDAEFIAKKCLMGTRVRIYESNEPNEDLRALLMISSFTGENGMTYQEFLGISEDALGNGSSGEDVLDLQYRLSDLGYYDGEFSGEYDVTVIGAVKHLQKDLGLSQNGISSAELLELIYSEDAPISSGEITLAEGKSGPAVKKLQSALNQLGIYNGDIDSVYDLDVTEAVRQFQLLAGYTPDGIANPDVQHAAYYALNRVYEAVGEDFTASAETEEVMLARVNSEAKVNIRQYDDLESVSIGKVASGDTVTIVEVKGDWANIVAGDLNGYMYTEFLEPFTERNVVMQFTSADGSRSYTLGSSIAERESGAETLAEELADYIASEQFSAYKQENVIFATVNTGSDDLRLNMREEASKESAVLAEIPNGTTMRVLSQDDSWSYVGYDDKIGYLLNQYLTFREGTADEVESTDPSLGMDEEEVIKVMAVIVPDKGKKKVSFLDSANEDGVAVYRAEEGEEVEVLLVNDETGWVLVSGAEKQGYVREENLSFRLM